MEVPLRSANHTWISKKANWLDLLELGSPPHHDRSPTPESNMHGTEPLKLR